MPHRKTLTSKTLTTADIPLSVRSSEKNLELKIAQRVENAFRGTQKASASCQNYGINPSDIIHKLRGINTELVQTQQALVSSGKCLHLLHHLNRLCIATGAGQLLDHLPLRCKEIEEIASEGLALIGSSSRR